MSANTSSKTNNRHLAWGTIDLAVGLALALTIWTVLPARWAPVDIVGTAFALVSIAAGVGLVTGQPWARAVALVTSGVTLIAGLALVTAVALTASYLGGVYGPVGKGGAVILVFVALLLLPYFVIVPAAQIVALRPRAPGG